MRAFFLTLASGLIGMGLAPARELTVQVLDSASLKVPHKIGLAGMAAAHQAAQGARPPALLFAGGSNYALATPDAQTAEDFGPEFFYDRVGMMPAMNATYYCQTCEIAPQWVSKLPYKFAYAAFAGTHEGMIIAGGCNGEGHLKRVSRVRYEGHTAIIDPMPSLPTPLAYASFALVGRKFHVMGGLQNAEDKSCSSAHYVLDLDRMEAGWLNLPAMPSPRMLAATAVYQGRIYVMGGNSLQADAQGKAQRSYLKDVLIYDTAKQKWLTGQAADMPEAIAASPSPLAVEYGKAFLLGGKTGKAKASTRIYSYDFAKNTWSTQGELKIGVAHAPAVALPSTILILSGQTSPAARTPQIQVLSVEPRS